MHPLPRLETACRPARVCRQSFLEDRLVGQRGECCHEDRALRRDADAGIPVVNWAIVEHPRPRPVLAPVGLTQQLNPGKCADMRLTYISTDNQQFAAVSLANGRPATVAVRRADHPGVENLDRLSGEPISSGEHAQPRQQAHQAEPARG